MSSIQLAGIIFGGILLLGAFFARINAATRVTAIVFGSLIALVSLIGPEKIASIKAGDGSIELATYSENDLKNIELASLDLTNSTDSSPPIKENEQLDKLINKAKTRSDSKIKSTPEDFLLLATEKAKKNQIDQAINLTEKGLALKPQNARVKKTLLNNLGVLYTKKNKPQNAETQFQKALDLDKKNSRVLKNLGTLHLKTQQFDKAEKELKQVIKLDPKKVSTRKSLAEVYIAKKDFTKAETQLKTVVKQDPNNIEAHLKLGGIYKKQNNVEKAKTEYKKVLEIDPKQTQALKSLKVLKAPLQNSLNFTTR